MPSLRRLPILLPSFRCLKSRSLPRPTPSTLHIRRCSCAVPSSDKSQSISSRSSSIPLADAATSHNGLYTTSPYSPGSPLFDPEGSYIFNRLLSFLRAQYPIQGFTEVITPNIYKKSLWQVSGHWDNYADDMFSVRGRAKRPLIDSGPQPSSLKAQVSDQNTQVQAQAQTVLDNEGEYEEFGLKPMNCPGHCLLFATGKHSYRDLPIRYADFSALHRNEVSGSLTGLTRVRRFHQDDGHIFCRQDQIQSEIERALSFVRLVYSNVFRFAFPELRFVLSTRPEQDYIGDIETWNKAENQLRTALDASGTPWSLNEHDGAFYGPKIDITVRDPHVEGKWHQTATIQLDFQLPQRFGLRYQSALPQPALQDVNATDSGSASTPTSMETPVLIHRAVFGSIERFMALLLSSCEHSTNPLPLWLHPKPLAILTVNTDPQVVAYANLLRDELSFGILAPPGSANDPTLSQPLYQTQLYPLNTTYIPITLDASPRSLGKKKREAIKSGYAMIAVVGDRDIKQGRLVVEPTRLNQTSRDALESFFISSFSEKETKQWNTPISITSAQARAALVAVVERFK
jgi:threonyl-tRNA synthetase